MGQTFCLIFSFLGSAVQRWHKKVRVLIAHSELAVSFLHTSMSLRGTIKAPDCLGRQLRLTWGPTLQ